MAINQDSTLIGRRLGHFEILDKLGEGGMGVVYKARDTHLERFVAIKILPPAKAEDVDRRRRFAQEAKTASALNHPGIVTIYDITQHEGIDFIAMEFVPGRTLDRVIPRHGLGLNETLDYGVQIADALAAAHAAGIVHRDLKPANVIVNEQGRIKVLDFGLAKLVERVGLSARDDATVSQASPVTDHGAIVGTVAYMAPEQAEGKTVDARSDIFSRRCAACPQPAAKRWWSCRTWPTGLLRLRVTGSTSSPHDRRRRRAPSPFSRRLLGRRSQSRSSDLSPGGRPKC